MPTSGEIQPLSLYFHLPFCSRKCPYCHFYVIPDRESHKELLLPPLLLEIESLKEKMNDHQIVSIYFGGGTPSLFGAERVGKLLEAIGEVAPACEITLEANPEDTTKELVDSYRRVGINRMSLGIQSLHESSLQMIERTHSAKGAEAAIWAIREGGIENFSIDLMYDLPGQTVESFTHTLSKLKDLPATHVSLYNMTIEPHTPFHKRRKTLQLPSPEASHQMLTQAVTTLESIGLHRYEISAFAKPGFESRHNTGYWTGRPFFGLGPSAFSYFEGRRFRNVANIHRYTKAMEKGESPVDFEEKLPYPQNIQERLAVELRLLKGVDLEKFSPPPSLQSILEKLIEENYLLKEGNRVRLSEKGLLFYDTVASEIV